VLEVCLLWHFCKCGDFFTGLSEYQIETVSGFSACSASVLHSLNNEMAFRSVLEKKECNDLTGQVDVLVAYILLSSVVVFFVFFVFFFVFCFFFFFEVFLKTALMSYVFSVKQIRYQF
jgi:hypothetical protein